MSQGSTVLPTSGVFSGLVEQCYINAALAALLSNNSGATAPTSPTQYQLWANTSGGGQVTIQQYVGSTWVSLWSIDTATGNVSILAGTPGNWVIASGTSDAIVATYDPPATALADGMVSNFRAATANLTTAPTFNRDGLGAKTITRFGGEPLMTGDIPHSNAEVSLRYNLANTRWELMNPANGPSNWVVAGGTANAITASYTPPAPTLYDGMISSFRATAANTATAPTFSRDGSGALPITKCGGAPLVPGDIPGGLAEVMLRYNLANTRWELMNPRPIGPVTGAAQGRPAQFADSTGAVLQVGAFAFINICDPQWGAIGNASYDNAAIFQSAINYLNSNFVTGIIFVPPGNYHVSTTVTVKGGVIIIGSGANGTVLTGTGDYTVLNFDSSCHYAGLEKITISGYQNSAATNYTVTTANGVLVVFRDVWIAGGFYALEAQGVDGYFDNCYIIGFGTTGGCLISNGANWYHRCKFDNNAATVANAILIGAPYSGSNSGENHFVMCDFSGNFGNSVNISGQSTSPPNLTAFNGCVFS